MLALTARRRHRLIALADEALPAQGGDHIALIASLGAHSAFLSARARQETSRQAINTGRRLLFCRGLRRGLCHLPDGPIDL